MPENKREDGARAKEVLALVNTAAAVGIAVLVGVGGYLLFGGDGGSPSGPTKTIESLDKAAPPAAAAVDTDTPAPGVSTPAVEAPTARAADDSPNRLLRRSFSCSQVSPPNPLFRAVERGDVEIATILADLCAEHLDTVYEQAIYLHETPLSLAVKAQAIEMVRILLEAGADPDTTTQNAFYLYETPLSLAVKAQAIEMVRILLEAGADPDTTTQNAFRLYETPLSLAVKAQAIEMVRILLEAGADPDTTTQNAFRLYETPLSLAVKAQAIEMVRILVNAGADPNKSLERGFRLMLSPLDIAIEEGYTEIANILVGTFN